MCGTVPALTQVSYQPLPEKHSGASRNEMVEMDWGRRNKLYLSGLMGIAEGKQVMGRGFDV